MKKLCLTLWILLALCLPFQALAAAELPPDGEYTVEVTLSGGSGRTAIASPASLSSIGGTATALIIWDSPHYSFMEVNGIQYDPVPTEDSETTAFSIPVVLDEEMAVKAQTEAMSQPHLIEYTLYFDSDSLEPVEEERSVPFDKGILIIVILVLCYFISQRQRKSKSGRTR